MLLLFLDGNLCSCDSCQQWPSPADCWQASTCFDVYDNMIFLFAFMTVSKSLWILWATCSCTDIVWDISRRGSISMVWTTKHWSIIIHKEATIQGIILWLRTSKINIQVTSIWQKMIFLRPTTITWSSLHCTSPQQHPWKCPHLHHHDIPRFGYLFKFSEPVLCQILRF